jgi:membrane protein DedA with SNARE-associated domain
MMPVGALFLHSRTIDHILSTYGYAAVFGMTAIESLGVPVPGETTLIAAALYAGATGNLTIWLVVVAAAGGAIAGDNVGFSIGRYGGFRLLRRYGEKIHVDERRLKLGHWLFRRHGGKVVFFGRFVSILRTYAAFLAGTNRMAWLRFLAFNAAGGIVWAAAFGFAYYYFGRALKGLQTPVDIGLGVAASVVVIAFLVYVKRKEGELADRAEREVADEELAALADGDADAPT